MTLYDMVVREAKDLELMVNRLIARIRKLSPDDPVAEQAAELLRKQGRGSPLRTPDSAGPVHEE